MRTVSLASMAMSSILLATCAVSGTMTAAGSAYAASAKYKNAVAVRNVVDDCNIYKVGLKSPICVPSMSSADVKQALEKSLQANGYLATGTPKYHVDVQIREVRVQLLAAEVMSNVTYTVSGDGAARKYAVQATGHPHIASMPIGLLRQQTAYTNSLEQNFKQFTQRLR